MTLTRRQLIKRSLLMGAATPFVLGAAWADQDFPLAPGRTGEIALYGDDDSATGLGLGLRQQGWKPHYQGALDPLSLASLPASAWAAGFTDEAGLAVLTSLLVGRGRILALGRHETGAHHLVSHRGPLAESLAVEAGSWQAALGREYARLALAGSTPSHARQFTRLAGDTVHTGELSFLVRF